MSWIQQSKCYLWNEIWWSFSCSLKGKTSLILVPKECSHYWIGKCIPNLIPVFIPQISWPCWIVLVYLRYWQWIIIYWQEFLCLEWYPQFRCSYQTISLEWEVLTFQLHERLMIVAGKGVFSLLEWGDTFQPECQFSYWKWSAYSKHPTVVY